MAQIEDLDNTDITAMTDEELRNHIKAIRDRRYAGATAKRAAPAKRNQKKKSLDLNGMSNEERLALLKELQGE